MQELASLAIAADTALMVMELSAEFSHVVALNVFLFKQLFFSMSVRAIVPEFAFTKVNDILAHLSLPFHFDCLVEFLSLFDVSEELLLLLAVGRHVA